MSGVDRRRDHGCADRTGRVIGKLTAVVVIEGLMGCFAGSSQDGEESNGKLGVHLVDGVKKGRWRG